MPLPGLMAFLAVASELAGSVMLLFGFGVRWIAIPLMVTMVVAAVTVHLQNGWLAIAEGSGLFASERTKGAVERLDKAKDILHEHGNYEWLTQNASFVVLNNGIEFLSTYLIMLLVLFFVGAVLIFSIPKPKQVRGVHNQSWETLSAGFRYIWREKIVLGAISLDMFAVLLGGALLTLADTAARTLISPMQLPVGVLTALIGVPVFLLLLRRGAPR